MFVHRLDSLFSAQVADPDDPRYGVSLADGKVGEALGPKGYYGLLFQFLASCDGSRLSWI